MAEGMADDMAADDTAADFHRRLETTGLAERYLLGRLDRGEAERFEDHLVGCPRCQDEVEAARGLRLGLRAVATQAAVSAAVASGLRAHLRRRSAGLPLWAASLALFLVAGVAVAFLAVERQRLTTDLADATGRGTAEIHRLREELDAERARRGEAERVAAAGEGELARPLAGLPVYLLAAIRGTTDDGGSEAATVIDLGAASDGLVLAVDAAADPRYVTHRVVVADAEGEVVFRRDGLQPDALEAILVTFPAAFFAPGEYQLELYGVGPDGATERLARHRLLARA